MKQLALILHPASVQDSLGNRTGLLVSELTSQVCSVSDVGRVANKQYSIFIIRWHFSATALMLVLFGCLVTLFCAPPNSVILGTSRQIVHVPCEIVQLQRGRYR